MKNGLKATAVFAVAAAFAPGARAQMTGVSQPEQVSADIPASAQTNQQTPGYQPTPSATVSAMQLRTRPTNGAEVDATVSTPQPQEITVVPMTAPQNQAVDSPAQTLSAHDRAALRANDDDSLSERPRKDADERIVTEWEGPANALPPGTLIRARIQEQLSSTDTTVGRIFHAELSEPVERNGRILLPPGAVITGRVTDVHSGKRITGAASIHLQPLEVTMPDGLKYRIVGQVVDTNIYQHVKVDSEGTILRRDHAAKTIAELGLATGAGAATGGVIAGPAGALVGGAVGAGIGTTVWLKQDRQTEIPAGTGLVFALNEALLVGSE